MFRSQTLAPLWDTSMELDKVSCRVKMVSKYQVFTIFVCDKAVVIVAMPMDTVLQSVCRHN